MVSICLAMIVKNEAHIIKECLESVKPYIDSWIICDTGSTDETVEIIKETLKEIPGELHLDEWIGYGQNRTKSIQRASTKADYILVADADFILQVEDLEFKNKLADEAYAIKVNEYHLHFLLRSDLGWKFESYVHEYPSCGRKFGWSHLEGVKYIHTMKGGNRDTKTERERELLFKDLESGHNISRTYFYLGQNYQESRDYESAVENYLLSYQSSYSEEDKYVSLVRIASISQSPHEWFKALMFRPKRHDAYLGLARLLNQKGNYQLAYNFATMGYKLPNSNDIVFNDWEFSRWKFLDELIISCYYLERWVEGYKYCVAIKMLEIPTEHKERINKNISYFQNYLDR